MSQNPFDPNYRSPETPQTPPPYQQGNPQQYPPPGYQQPPPGYVPPPPPYGYQQPPFGYQQGNFYGMQEDLPQASSAQTCGIIGLVLFFNIIGIILNIVALVQSGNAMNQYAQFPGRYTETSFRKAKTGRTCATIGLSLLGLVILVVVVAVAANA